MNTQAAIDRRIRSLIGPENDYRIDERWDVPERVALVFPRGDPDHAAAFVLWCADYLAEESPGRLDGTERGFRAATAAIHHA
jgi:hypothetical protein